MPLYNFQREFAPAVVAGLWDLLRGGENEHSPADEIWLAEFERLMALKERFEVDIFDPPIKRQTIRMPRKRQTRPGETLYFYTGCRTKECVKLGEAACKTVEPLELQEYREGPLVGVAVHQAGKWRPLTHEFAQADGFSDIWAMQEWFEKTHGLSPKNPLFPELITW